MTQEKDKQEKLKQESPTNELPDADLDKVSGGLEPVNGVRAPKPAEPITERK